MLTRVGTRVAVTTAAIGAVLSTVKPEPKVAAASSQCLGADSVSANLISYITDLINTTNVQLAALRDSVGLTGVSPSSLVLVADKNICAKAAAALDNLANVQSSGRLVYVVQAGNSRYVVEDPNGTAGEHLMAWIYDSRFRLVQGLAR